MPQTPSAIGPETPVRFTGTGIELEGLLSATDSGLGAVICHPHPIFGGTMRNPVVAAITAAYRAHGVTTLRFNFRGVGASGGAYGAGDGEREDVRAAVAHLRSRGCGRVALAGYSFGAWINALGGCPADGAWHMLMVSPPIHFLDFSPVGSLPCLKMVVAGDDDDFISERGLRDMLAVWNPSSRLEFIRYADHFYGDVMDRLAEVLNAFVADEVSPAARRSC